MALLQKDELNNLAIPYEQYFGEMGLTPDEIRIRIGLAEAIDDVFMLLFLMIMADVALDNPIDENYYVDYGARQYIDTLENLGIDVEDAYPWLKTHVYEAVREVVKQNAKNPDDEWQTSKDRAKLIAENEANSVCEYTAFQDAVDSGKTRKTWNTMLDPKVRHTHEDVENITIPIMDTFKVGAYEMYQPKDTSLGAGMEEIANCRCWCTYS